MMTRKKKNLISYVVFAVVCVAIIIAGICYKNYSNEQKLKKAEKNAITCVDDITGKKIGVQIGTTGDIYASDYEGDKEGTVVERYNKGTDAIQALKDDKINCVILDEQPSLAYTEKNTELKILEEEFAVEDYAICIDKSNGELKSKINDALAKLQKDGTLADIKKNYTGKDEEKGKFPYKKKNVSGKNGTLKVGTNAAFKPYEYYDNNQITGLDIDMMQAVCDELDMKLQVEDMEFDSIIAAVTSGKVDVGCAGMTVTEDRLKNVDFTDSYTTAKQVIIVKDYKAAIKAQSLAQRFHDNFISDHRYNYLVKGFANTIVITIFAVIMGIILGAIIALIRTTHDNNGTLPIPNLICKIYLTVVRGTPAMVQLLIFYYIILVSVNSKILVAIIAFGLNSAAYVAEVIRSGINSIDHGQFEAGRSLGLNNRQTMTMVVLPQAIKNVLPALGNEIITLLKETSVAGYVALADITYIGNMIRSRTYEAFFPLITVALIYLVIVLVLSYILRRFERRLKKSER